MTTEQNESESEYNGFVSISSEGETRSSVDNREPACRWVPEVVHVGDLLHTQPAELTGTHSAVHTIAAAVIGLHDVGTAARARFDLLCVYKCTSTR